ncbi:aspartate aminotransferase family protein [Pseudomonas kuykendallii]|uniref:Aspartate aminotransferase family protein n=1 Tax=Pseudomonas kuykendallii TaxID=1007099 RepID=A0A2W5F2Z5_9PSED|nr:aspartate aminotransferase family protein [Pseudomonas kuykendallii]PZP25542.1 MAG: aspartate aminotransferase family protein [Pseudomonas kuykendallii]
MTESKQILQLNRFDMASAERLDARLATLVERRRASFGASSVLFYQKPLEIVRAEGVTMFDAAGKAYLDVYNNVPTVGHCHPQVVEAISRQAALLATNSRYLYENLHTYAETLLATFPASLSNLVLTCTGSESNDIALRMAQTHTGGNGFVVTETAYHGNTTAVMEISPSSYRKGSPLPPHIRTIPAPDSYHLEPGQKVGTVFAAHLRAAIADLQNNGITFAGLVVDTVFSSDGVFADPAGFLAEALAVVHEAGGLFIADEVQPGFGRTGKGHWCFARHGIEPDIVTLGKPMGNGYPMAGVVTRPELLEAFCAETGYFNTFGANPVAAAAGLAVLQVIEQEGLIANADRIGTLLRDGLRDLGRRDERIGDVRGAGLFIGLEFSRGEREPDANLAAYVINAMKEEGILIGAAGAYGNVLKIRPALCFGEDNAGFFVETLEKVLRGV